MISQNILNQGVGRKADAAALKFCYVDMTSAKPMSKVFNQYKNEVEKT
jgi:hypothetical protein